MTGIKEGYAVTREGRVEITDPVGSGGADELDHFFIDCIKQNRPITSPAANLDEAVKTVALTEGILKGLRE